MEELAVSLLGNGDPDRARRFILAYEERRTSTWADAAREAGARSASRWHIPHLRGQLRYQLGEAGLAEAAEVASVGCQPILAPNNGAAFMAARVGKLAIVGQVLWTQSRLPRRSVTRKLLSRANEVIDPQGVFNLEPGRRHEAVTELAYLACLVSIPNRADPSVPASMGLAIPSAELDRWLVWMPLHKVHELLQGRAQDAASDSTAEPSSIADKAFARFRFPITREAGEPES